MVNRDGIYQGGVFSPEIDGGRAGAEITLSVSGLSAVTSTGQNFTLPYSQCRIEIGGASGKMIFCRTEDKSLTIFCEQKGFFEDLRKDGRGFLDEQIAEVIQEKKRNRINGWKISIAMFLIAAMILTGGYYTLTWAARKAVLALPVTADQRIGELAMSNLQFDGQEIDDPIVARAIGEMIERLKPHAAVKEFKYEVKIIDADITNAFALPGGYIVVYTGLLKKAERPEHVAGVIAHEMSHATLRHGLTRISQSLTINVAMAVLLQDSEGLITSAGRAAQMLATNSYSRQQETQADIEALRMLHAAGIDPQGLPEMFKLMQAGDKSGQGVPEWFSSHPEMNKRIQEIQKSIDALPTAHYNPLVCNWKNVLQRLSSAKMTTKTKTQPAAKPVLIGQ